MAETHILYKEMLLMLAPVFFGVCGFIYALSKWMLSGFEKRQNERYKEQEHQQNKRYEQQDKKFDERFAQLRAAIDKREIEVENIASKDSAKIWQSISKLQDSCMMESTHALVCKNLEQRMNRVFTECFSKLKDELFAKVRSLEMNK